MPDGRIKYLQEQCETFYDSDGKPLRSVGIVQDITESQKAENERIQLRNELAHIGRVMTMSELSATLAHEINQPLGAILNNATAAQILSAKLKEGNKEFQEILSDINADAVRASDIIRKIRGIVKKEDVKFERVNLNVLIERVVDLYKNALNVEKISIFLDLLPELAPTKGDRVKLQQVFMNLVSNASEALRKSSIKTLKIRSVMQSSDMITVSVSDSGTGIDDAVKDKIFQPFFTTKKDGLGMGLRISLSIIEEHGGRIWVENNTTAGATSYISLKAYRGESE